MVSEAVYIIVILVCIYQFSSLQQTFGLKNPHSLFLGVSQTLVFSSAEGLEDIRMGNPCATVMVVLKSGY